MGVCVTIYVYLRVFVCVCVTLFYSTMSQLESNKRNTEFRFTSPKQTNMQIHTHIHKMAARGVLGDHPPIRLMIRSATLFAVNVNIRIGGL